MNNLLSFGLKNMGTIQSIINGIGMIRPLFGRQNQMYNPYLNQMNPYMNQYNPYNNPFNPYMMNNYSQQYNPYNPQQYNPYNPQFMNSGYQGSPMSGLSGIGNLLQGLFRK